MKFRFMILSVCMYVSYLQGMNDSQFDTLLRKSLGFFDLTTCAYLEQKKAAQPDALPQTQETIAAPDNMPIRTHVLHVYPQKKIVCKFGCGNSFNSITGLKYHERNKHREMAEYPCSMCEKYFFSYPGLVQHIRKKHS